MLSLFRKNSKLSRFLYDFFKLFLQNYKWEVLVRLSFTFVFLFSYDIDS